MNTEILIGLISSFIGGTAVALITHWSTRKKTEAEAKKFEAEAEREKAEAERAKVETTKLLIEMELQQGGKAGDSTLPTGWLMYSEYPSDYEVGLDHKIAYSGQASGYIKARENPRSFATLMQNFKANKYLDKRIRLTGFVKVENVNNYAGLWMRVDGQKDETSKHKILAFDNMDDRPIKGTVDWRKYSIVLDVPKNGTSISFGVNLSGRGQVWVDEIQFEVVDNEMPTTNQQTIIEIPEHPVNLDFESNK